MMHENLHARRNVRITADDDVPADIRQIVSSHIERVIPQATADDYLEVTIAKRKNPDEIYDVRVGKPGAEFQQDFQRGDLDSERFDLWLEQKGKHFGARCWCGHAPEEHSLPQCRTCEA